MTVHDPHDPAAVKLSRAQQRLRERQRATDWVWLVSDPRGRRIVAELAAPLIDLSFSPDALRMAFAEGRRDFARAIQSLASRVGFDALAASSAVGASDGRRGDDTGRDGDGDGDGDAGGSDLPGD